MLDAAGLALSQGALIEPPGQNALELYRAVLARDPGNDLARRGIDSVADELIVQAERALMEQDVTRLASAVDAVRSVRPDHARLPFFISQLEQERAIQGKAGQPVRAVDSLGRPIETPAGSGELPSVRVQAFVQLANERMRSNQLVGKDGALGYVISARRIDASDPGVGAAVDALGVQFQNTAQRAIRENRLDDANRWYQNALELNMDRTQLAAMRADIDAARIGNERADRARLLVLANQRIAQGRLIEPRSDSAQHYVDLLRAADPKFEGLADTSALLASRALAESRAAMGANNLDRADAFLRAAADAGAPAAEVADINAKIMSMRVVRPAAVRAEEPAVLPENKLRRTAFMAPDLPGPRARARHRGLGRPRVHGGEGRHDARSAWCAPRSPPVHSTARRWMPSSAGATSRASSAATSSSSASRRACASACRNSYRRGRTPSYSTSPWSPSPRNEGCVPSFSALTRSCARPSAQATTAQARRPPRRRAPSRRGSPKAETIASWAFATTKSLVRYTSVSLTFFALYFDSRSTVV